jgi:hypothetical protein
MTGTCGAVIETGLRSDRLPSPFRLRTSKPRRLGVTAFPSFRFRQQVTKLDAAGLSGFLPNDLRLGTIDGQHRAVAFLPSSTSLKLVISAVDGFQLLHVLSLRLLKIQDDQTVSRSCEGAGNVSPKQFFLPRGLLQRRNSSSFAVSRSKVVRDQPGCNSESLPRRTIGLPRAAKRSSSSSQGKWSHEFHSGSRGEGKREVEPCGLTSDLPTLPHLSNLICSALYEWGFPERGSRSGSGTQFLPGELVQS